ncbi:MAG: hypothetical protein HFE27_00145 [Clostridia bacterium]|jgi:uncharacterized membrane protein YsdA (DUF1294 family)|nr:hypothetical protein [Clostridia bacterium]
MLLLYILFAVYIFAINFYAFRLLKTQREDWEDGKSFQKSDGKLILSAIMGGAIAVYVSMFCMKFRLSNLLFMIVMPLLAVLNVYCFFLGYRGIYFLL